MKRFESAMDSETGMILVTVPTPVWAALPEDENLRFVAHVTDEEREIVDESSDEDMDLTLSD